MALGLDTDDQSCDGIVHLRLHSSRRGFSLVQAKTASTDELLHEDIRCLRDLDQCVQNKTRHITYIVVCTPSNPLRKTCNLVALNSCCYCSFQCPVRHRS